MSSFFHKKSKPKDEDAIPSGFTFSHAKDILSVAASVSKAVQIPHLEGAAEIKQARLYEHCAGYCRAFVRD
jgi:hypothetical protein